jgi:small subunit ribosomal protein S18
MPPTKTNKKRRPKEKDDKGWQKKGKRKICIFCKEKIDHVDYKDVGSLRKFVSDRGKIRARRVTGNCSQHQRDVALAVKNAREMALLPYSAR